jgi:hypothetical protein
MQSNSNPRIVKLMEVRYHGDPDADTSYLDQECFEDRRDEYVRGEFNFIGIDARVTIVVAGVMQEITSGGLWGIEDDSDGEYLDGLAGEQLNELADILHDLGFGTDDIADAFPEGFELEVTA